MEDLITSLTRDNPREVKAVLATVTLALAVYQIVLIAIAYRGNAATARAHRASGDDDGGGDRGGRGHGALVIPRA